MVPCRCWVWYTVLWKLVCNYFIVNGINFAVVWILFEFSKTLKFFFSPKQRFNSKFFASPKIFVRKRLHVFGNFVMIFWCLVHFCLIFTWQIFYDEARVLPYFLVRNFGSWTFIVGFEVCNCFSTIFLIFLSMTLVVFNNYNFVAIFFVFLFAIYMLSHTWIAIFFNFG